MYNTKANNHAHYTNVHSTQKTNVHSTLKHTTQIPIWAHKKGGEEKKGECRVVQMFYNNMIL